MLRAGIFIILLAVGLFYFFSLADDNTNQAQMNNQQTDDTEVGEEITPEGVDEEKIEVIEGKEDED